MKRTHISVGNSPQDAEKTVSFDPDEAAAFWDAVYNLSGSQDGGLIDYLSSGNQTQQRTAQALKSLQEIVTGTPVS